MKKTKERPSHAPCPPLPAPCAAAQPLPVDALTPRPDNRDVADDSALAELADSLRAVGQLHPIHARALSDGGYEILAGVRRWLASKKNGAETVLAVVHTGCDEAVADAIRFAENEHRADPSALDTARALRRIKNLHGYTHGEVADATGISVSRVKRYLCVFAASDGLLGAIEKERLSIEVATELARYEKERGEVACRKLLRRAGELTRREVARARRNAKGANAQPKTPRDPWVTVSKRIQKLVAADPDVARQHLEAALALVEATSAPVEASC